MTESERKKIIKQFERELLKAHLRGSLPPNFRKTLMMLESMGIDPDEVLDNAFYKFDLLTTLYNTGQAQPLQLRNIDISKLEVTDIISNTRPDTISTDGLKSFTVSGDSMVGAGICNGDIVLTTKDDFENGAIYVVKYEGMYFVKRLEKTEGGYRLVSANPKYQSVEIKNTKDLQLIGKVKYILKPIK
ncbi:MAG: helix-turn-helix transcriptional regulator [Candidatus Kapaibacteriota bacterium]